ncbi:MAG TPA: DUF4956 domain-containing protein [Patescibacteria group bacterium]|nr:DUF4956 domain-containing protein [Patescibacteria group bacterium]
MRRLAHGPRLRPFLLGAGILMGIALLAVADSSLDQHSPSAAASLETGDLRSLDDTAQGVAKELQSAALRLPLAAALGAVLALRPRRRGTPLRDPAVVQTQIVLATVGAAIMLVVGASLPRAFAIVGVASLVRYRSKVKNPKDAVVMLSALAVGLASGVGVVALAVFSTLFLVGLLWVIEGFEPQTRIFELSVKLGDRTAELRPKIESVLRSFKVAYELRAVSADEASYRVTAPHEIRTDRASRALTELLPNDQGAVEWHEKSKARAE